MKTILVTGAQGFIGRNVAKYYSHLGWHVVGLGRSPWRAADYASWGISTWLQSSLQVDGPLQLDSVPDVIVHCAGGSNVGHSFISPGDDFRMTVVSLQRVLEFIRSEAPNCALVYLSSAAVYGSTNQLPIKESYRTAPISMYGSNKFICEQLVQAYAKHYGIRSAILRLFSVYGPGLRKQIFWDACRKAQSRQTEFFGTGTETRDFIHIDDTVTLIGAAYRASSEACPIGNGGTGTPTRIKDLVAKIFGCLDSDLSPQFTKTLRSGDPHDYLADLTLTKTWGWKPEIQLDCGIRGYVDWFMSLAGREEPIT